MSHSKLTRALIVAATLLGAIPLMAQQPAAAAPDFPYGRYSMVAIDSTNGPPPGIEVEFTQGAVKVFRGGQQVEAHGFTFADGKAQFFQLGGQCIEVGEYSWSVVGGFLELALIADPCPGRSASIVAVRFRKI